MFYYLELDLEEEKIMTKTENQKTNRPQDDGDIYFNYLTHF